jgi:hypothetical protein
MPATELVLACSLLERADLTTELRHMRRRLVGEFASHIPEGVIGREIQRELEALGHVRTHHLVPLLVERQVRRRLLDMCTDRVSF